MTLYAIDAQLLSIIDSFACLNDGEIPQSLSDQLDSLVMDRQEKVENIVKFARSKLARISAIQAEIDRLQAEGDRERLLVDDLKAYLKRSMESHGESKIETDLFTIRIQRNPPSVKINCDVDDLPGWAKVVKVEASKSKILEMVKQGLVKCPDGVEITTGTHLRGV